MPLASLFKNKSDANVVNKDLTVIAENISVKYKEPFDVRNIEISFNNADLWKNIAWCNYLYLPDTKRYYFVDELIIERGFVKIKGHSDVVSSFWNFYKKNYCYINRQEGVYSPYIVDELYPVYATREQTIQQIPNTPFTGSSITLTVTGGV